MGTKQFLSALLIFCLSCLYSYSQDYSPKLGPYSNKNKFKFNAEDTKTLYLRRQVPKNDKVIAYNDEGKKFELKTTDTISVSKIYEGIWDGKKGKWLSFYDKNLALSRYVGIAYYVLLSDMKDVENEAEISDKIIYEEKGRRALKDFGGKMLTTYVPFFVASAIFLIMLIRFLTIRKFPLKVKPKSYKFDYLTLEVIPFEFRKVHVTSSGSYSGNVTSGGNVTVTPNYFTTYSYHNGWKINIYNGSNRLFDFKTHIIAYDEFNRLANTNPNVKIFDVRPNQKGSVLVYSNRDKVVLDCIEISERDKIQSSTIIKKFEKINIELPSVNYSKAYIIITSFLTLGLCLASFWIIDKHELFDSSRYDLIIPLGLSFFFAFLATLSVIAKGKASTILMSLCVILGASCFSLVPLLMAICALSFLLIVAHRRISWKDLYKGYTPENYHNECV